MPEQRKRRPSVLAVDLGGTKIIVAIVSADGKIVAEQRHPTGAGEGVRPVIDRLLAAIDRLLAAEKMEVSQLDGISVAAAGAIDSDRGIINLSPNLPGWRDIPLKDIIMDRYGTKVFLVNDASAAALGEQRCGVERGVDNLILITVGTGIGGGIIINGELYTGPSGSAGEIGHMTIDVNGLKCACGNTGCLETLASGTAIAREAKGRMGSGEKSSLVGMVKGKIEDITAEKVGAAARSGDALSQDVIHKAATYLGVGMVNVVNIFNPEMIVVGGGVAKLGELLLEPARKVVTARAFPISARAVRIVVSGLGDEAGVLGAAAFACQQMT